MAPEKPPKGPAKGQQQKGQQQPQNRNKKRKDPPTQASKGGNDKRPRFDHRSKQRDAKIISTQATGKAFKNGELDVDKFVKAREFEIRALENGMQRSRKALNQRAFQQVPKDLRRRTASHNVKRVPKRLRERGTREMIEDNTPTVTARRRKPTRHMRLRLETAKQLRALGAKKKAERDKLKVTVIDPKTASAEAEHAEPTQDKPAAITTRKPRTKKTKLAQPPLPKAKFRKRQIHKSWLPTHMFHAKRAHMTPPSAPLWRFAIPMTPTAKCYRPTHRASHERGAVAWDMSYVSTIGLQGRQDSLTGMLRALCVNEDDLSGKKGAKWRQGVRMLETFLYEREAPPKLIAPVTVMWQVADLQASASAMVEADKQKRKVLLRVHPSAFFQLWEELLRLAKVAKPEIKVEDLRFEIGSIEISGPGATEALLGVLWYTRYSPDNATLSSGAKDAADNQAMSVDQPADNTAIGRVWSSLSGLTNPTMLPHGSSLSFTIQDPRLHHPPRTIRLPQNDAGQSRLLETIASWPVDALQNSQELFDSKARRTAAKAQPSQKAINRRKGAAAPGSYPTPQNADPKIPLSLYATSSNTATSANTKRHSKQGSWTLLLPWRCVQSVWYSIMYYPLSTGQQPSFGGLDEVRQLAFEAGKPWFPADFPGTRAGWEWEMKERVQRWDEWKRRPKGKRTSWEKVELGDGKKGEVGVGWNCDWERLLNGPVVAARGQVELADKEDQPAPSRSEDRHHAQPPSAAPMPAGLAHLPASKAFDLLTSSNTPPPPTPSPSLFTITLTLLTRGVPQTCARIYRLPNDPSLRQAWLALLPSTNPRTHNRRPKHSLPPLPRDAPPHVVQQRLAQSLIEPPKAGEETYPASPGEDDLIGFVTTGNFNLAEGRGSGVGCLVLGKVVEAWSEEEGRLCVVRNAGNGVGRLGRWEFA
ncbi:Ribonucleases P/MRP protein subunit pop1 [Teratosphaeria destructans]|uniref:Ribonucleases P/MRP protein subunit pop1 n=1 Tax=Teratosphaeria destructans TaxID=418781 RepID=A0A9W7SKB9_9PEZI|nr:Ribonucleases P/MRP protein subunit pop1 [Teratosphaeria destructans]